MNHLLTIILLLGFLTGCLAAPSSGKGKCDRGVCIQITVVEPIKYKEPIIITIIVISDKDREIDVALSTMPNVTYVESKTAGSSITPDWNGPGNVAWNKHNLKANTPTIFTNTVILTQEIDNYIGVSAVASEISVSNSLTIRYSPEGAEAYIDGSPMPTRFGPEPTRPAKYTPTAADIRLPKLTIETPRPTHTLSSYPAPQITSTKNSQPKSIPTAYPVLKP